MPSGVYVRTKPARKLSPQEIENLRIRNTGRLVSEETRARMRAAKLGKPGPWTGIKRGPMPEGWRKAISDGHPKGRDSPHWGRPPKRNKWSWYNGTHFRSTWEVRFAMALDRRGMKWEYEGRSFDLGHRTYTPDFYTPEDGVYWEVKGWLNDDSKDKITAFRRQFPELNLIVVTGPVLQLMEH